MGKALTWRTLACTLLPMLAAAGGAQAQSYGYGYDDDWTGQSSVDTQLPLCA
nr:hypothetical protein [Stenotrophomonas pavanii]